MDDMEPEDKPPEERPKTQSDSSGSGSGRRRTRVGAGDGQESDKPSIKLIKLAQEEARDLGHNYVGTENLLAALARYPVGIVPQVFADLGLTHEAIQAEFKALVGIGKGFVAVEIPFTPRAKRVLELTLDEARKLKHNYIGPEHILLGLLREEDGIHQRILEKLGIDPESIRKLVLQRLKSG